MAGMLSQGQQIPSSGPGPQTPPVGNPGAGTPLPSSASGPGQPPGAMPAAAGAGKPSGPMPPPNSQRFQELRDEAVQLLYGENFDKMIEMFQTNGPEQFARSMALTINSALQALEAKYGKATTAPQYQVAAEIGMDLMMKLLEDVIGGRIVPDVTLEQVQEVMPATLVMYADSHPELSKEELQVLMTEVERGVMEQTGAAPAAGAGGAAPPAQPPAAPLSTGPGPEPSGSPVPPGAV